MYESANVEVKFRHSKQRVWVDIEQIRGRIVSFLEHYCDFPLVDAEFLASVEGTTGEEKLSSLLARTGFADDPASFIQALIERLQVASSADADPIELGGVTLPYHLLLEVLAVLLPGEGFKTIKKVRQLEDLANIVVPAGEREDLQQVIDLYPVRLSMHTVRQMRLSRNVAYQYQPFVGELDPTGEVHTWIGQFWRGIIEQMYQNRVIFVMNMSCPVYCRFCFRKHKECRNQKAPTKFHVKQSIIYIQNAPLVKEVVLTGGDPFMNRATLQHAVQELGKIPHVQTLRLASRAISYYPELFLKDGDYWLNYLVKTNLDLHQKGKRLEVATHFIHPDEISVDALHIISHLARNGVPVYVQTPFVNGCNESGREMVDLFNVLRAAGAEIHYIFMPTSPIQGNKVYWSTIAQGLEAGRHLRAHLTDRAMPHVTTATSIGKIDWNTSGWAVERREREEGGEKEQELQQIWIRTPYTNEYFEQFAPIMQVSDTVRPNLEGTLDAAFMAEIGDDRLLAGPRGLTSSPEATEYKLTKTAETVEASLQFLQAACRDQQHILGASIVRQPCRCLARLHRARVELDGAAPDEELEAAYSHIAARTEITDVVLTRKDDVLSGFSRTLEVIDRLRRIPHVLAIRLRSLKLAYAPSAFTRAAISRLAFRNALQVVRPTRLEVETQFLHSSEFRPEHARLVNELRLRGITVYNNTPLLGYINDNGEEMLRISAGCRDLGIEFCNVYVAGLPIQTEWNQRYPIELNSVIDVATHVRRHGSGREIPRYLVRTALGEVDFSIVPRIFEPDEQGDPARVRVRLLDHDLGFFRAMDRDFTWPDEVKLDGEGQPLVPVEGVSLENQQFLFEPLVDPGDDPEQ